MLPNLKDGGHIWNKPRYSGLLSFQVLGPLSLKVGIYKTK